VTLEARSARRERRDGREVLAFGGSDYLALSHEPALRAAFVAAAERFGVSLAASRATSGTCVEHEALERELASFLGAEDCAVVASGSLANDVAAAALATEFGPARPSVWTHERTHASLSDALRARVGELRRFAEPHDVEPAARVIASDAFVPLTGRSAPLRELARSLAPGGVLLVDEAHSLGVLGPHGAGVAVASTVPASARLTTGSLSKAAGAVGGFVAGTRARIAAARACSAYVGSTALSPALAALARRALELVMASDGRRARLFRHVERVRARFGELGLPVGAEPFPVFGLSFATPERTLAVERALLERGVAVPRVRYLDDGPSGVLRLTLNAAHEDADVERLLAALSAALGGSP
jgi:8-amino-7-oxononanoate synthase